MRPGRVALPVAKGLAGQAKVLYRHGLAGRSVVMAAEMARAA